ncbi:hypothetical protein ACP275_06G147600 [Erythranthe tilingii]
MAAPPAGRDADSRSHLFFLLQNTIVDERGSFAVSSLFPGPLVQILKSIRKLPARVALVGDVVRLEDEKANSAAESLRETVLAYQRAVNESSYSVSGILSSPEVNSTSRIENLQDLFQGNDQYSVYRFNISSCMYIDGKGGTHEVNLEDMEKSKADPLSPFLTSLIDGINRSETRRRALVLFCIAFLNENAKDAFLLSADRKGFEVLGKVLGSLNEDGSREYQWKELRFTFKEEARDLEIFCQHLLQMEEEALKSISHSAGI